jgi:hypothetical protein
MTDSDSDTNSTGESEAEDHSGLAGAGSIKATGPDTLGGGSSDKQSGDVSADLPSDPDATGGSSVAPDSSGTPSGSDGQTTRDREAADEQSGGTNEAAGDDAEADDAGVTLGELPLQGNRDSVYDGRVHRRLALRPEVCEHERQVHEQVNTEFTRSVAIADLREAVYIAGLAAESEVIDRLREMGYGTDRATQAVDQVLKELDVELDALDVRAVRENTSVEEILTDDKTDS